MNQKPRAKPRATETGFAVIVRMQSELLEALDDWRRDQRDLPTRPEAIRRLMEGALKPGKRQR